MASVRTPVWLDCDPGHDDAMAILLAAYTSSIELIGLSCVAGNQSLDKITSNCLDVLHAINYDIPVIKGASMPLVRDHKSCPEIHGESGLDGPRGGKLLPPHPPALQPMEGKAIVEMARTIEAKFKEGTKVKLACTGPLTNAALLLTVYPEVIPMIDLVLMGGSVFAGGNISASAEFNIQVDPEAAKVVFESGVSIVMVPLDVTHKVLCTPGVLERVAGIECTETLQEQLTLSRIRISSIWRRQTEEEISQGTKDAYYKIVDSSTSKFRAAMCELLLFFAETYRKEHGFAHPPLHDPLTIAYVIDPSKFVVESMHVEIETMSPVSYGTTICDRRMKTTHPHNATVCLEVDIDWFWRIMIDAVGDADKVSPMNR